MSVSETNTPASTSTSVTATEDKNAPTQAEVVQKYKTKELVDFLSKEEDLELEKKDLEIIRKQRVNGRDFHKITEEKRECLMVLRLDLWTLLRSARRKN